MTEKRKYKRIPCKIKVQFEFVEGDPEEIDIEDSTPTTGTGLILDISKGGIFIVSKTRISINNPIKSTFKLKNDMCTIEGSVVRTGLIKNNPAEIAQKYSKKDLKEDVYIAVRFDQPLEKLSKSDL